MSPVRTHDSPVEGSGFEPSVPLPRLSSIRAVRAEIRRSKYGCLSARPRVRCLCPPGKTQHLLPESVFDRPGSDRWNLASTIFPDLLTRDRWFESGSLQRRVPCELNFDWLPLTDSEHALDRK